MLFFPTKLYSVRRVEHDKLGLTVFKVIIIMLEIGSLLVPLSILAWTKIM